MESQPYFVTTRAAARTAPFVGAAAATAVASLLRPRGRYCFSLFAYVFMPDHAHFVLVPAHSFDISRTMRVINGGIAAPSTVTPKQRARSGKMASMTASRVGSET